MFYENKEVACDISFLDTDLGWAVCQTKTGSTIGANNLCRSLGDGWILAKPKLLEQSQDVCGLLENMLGKLVQNDLVMQCNVKFIFEKKIKYKIQRILFVKDNQLSHYIHAISNETLI